MSKYQRNEANEEAAAEAEATDLTPSASVEEIADYYGEDSYEVEQAKANLALDERTPGTRMETGGGRSSATYLPREREEIVADVPPNLDEITQAVVDFKAARKAYTGLSTPALNRMWDSIESFMDAIVG